MIKILILIFIIINITIHMILFPLDMIFIEYNYYHFNIFLIYNMFTYLIVK